MARKKSSSPTRDGVPTQDGLPDPVRASLLRRRGDSVFEPGGPMRTGISDGYVGGAPSTAARASNQNQAHDQPSETPQAGATPTTVQAGDNQGTQPEGLGIAMELGTGSGETIGAKITRLRLARGLTHSELARRAGVSRPNIRRIESGQTPLFDTASKLASALGVEPFDLWQPVGSVDRDSKVERKAATVAVPVSIKNSAEVIRYSKILIVALEEALDYVPTRHHNQPPPALRIDDDPVYLQEIRNLVAELKTLNALLVQRSPRQNKRAATAIGGVARHFDTFLKTYAKSMGYGTAALTIGVIYHFLERAGVTPDITGSILGHLRLR